MAWDKRTCGWLVALALGCGDDGGGGASGGDTKGGGPDGCESGRCEDGTGTTTSPSGTGESTGTGASSSSTGVDATTSADTSSDGGSDTGEPDVCGRDPLDEPPDCTSDVPGAGAFDAVVTWTWGGDVELGFDRVDTTPLVVPLTDDNGDGRIDGCDEPDLVVVARRAIDWADPFDHAWADGRLYGIDGRTGDVLFRAEPPMHWQAQPAAADLDGDGAPEIVALGGLQTTANLLGFAADGSVLAPERWTPPVLPANQTWSLAQPPAIADVDHDGAPEVVVGPRMFDRKGTLLAWLPSFMPGEISDENERLGASVVVDLDGDGHVELLAGGTGYTWQDAWYWPYFAVTGGTARNGFPHVGDLDGDGEPEVLVTHAGGISVIDGDGSILVDAAQPVVPADDAPPGEWTWARPAAIDDFDGDGAREAAVAIAGTMLVLGLDGDALVVRASWPVVDRDGYGATVPTGFDLDGDGATELVYADEDALVVRSRLADAPVLELPRTSRLDHEYPVIADLDGDGSAEIVVVSNEHQSWNEPGVVSTGAPPLQVVAHARGQWMPARPIWNQHASYVTNVHLDATVPADPPPVSPLGSFRTNARMQDGRYCRPVGGA
jgi:hypothetical protein